MAEIVWDVNNLERRLPDGDTPPSGQVTNAAWTATLAEEIDGKPFSSYVYGSVSLGDPDPGDYTPFDQITKEQAIQWVKAALGEEQVAFFEKRLRDSIDEQAKPTTENGIPW